MSQALAIIKFFIEHKKLGVLVTVIMALEQYQLSAIIKNFISFRNEIINRLYFLKTSFLKQNSGDVVSERFVLSIQISLLAITYSNTSGHHLLHLAVPPATPDQIVCYKFDAIYLKR